MAYRNPGGLIAAAVILQCLVWLCVGVRLASRRKLRQRLLVSDWLIIAAMFFGLGLTIIQIYGCAAHALGRTMNGISLADAYNPTGPFNIARHLELSFLILGILTLGTIKISISFFYLHIFNTPTFKKIIIAWICVLVAWTVAFISSGLAECGNHLLALFSTPDAYLDHCGDAITVGYAMVGSNLATDVITLILPIPMIWSLQMPLRRKIAIAATFLVGLVSIGASTAKAYIYISTTLNVYKMDALVLITAIGIWNLVEVQVGMIAACAPTMTPVLKDWAHSASLNSLLSSLLDPFTRSSRSRSTENLTEKEMSRSSDEESMSPYAGGKDHSIVSRVEAQYPPPAATRAENGSQQGIHVYRGASFASTSSVV